jgi:DNA-binding NtrC family response regulator
MDTGKQIQFVLAGASLSDECGLRSILAGTPWEILATPVLEETVRALHETALPIVLFDRTMNGRPWQETLRLLLRARRRTCAIVLGDGPYPEPDDVIRRGAFDVLPRPFQKDEVLTMLLCAYSQARLHWLSFTRVQPRPGAAVDSPDLDRRRSQRLKSRVEDHHPNLVYIRGQV